jgi:hypothetical protein
LERPYFMAGLVPAMNVFGLRQRARVDRRA